MINKEDWQETTDFVTEPLKPLPGILQELLDEKHGTLNKNQHPRIQTIAKNIHHVLDLMEEPQHSPDWQPETIKDLFKFGYSHDFLTCMTTVKGFSELLQQKLFGKLTAEQNSLIQQVLDATQLARDRFLEIRDS